MGVVARSLRADDPVCRRVLLTLCSHAPVSLPGDSSVLPEAEAESEEAEAEEEADPNPTILHSSISRWRSIPNSSI